MNPINTENNASYNFVAPGIAEDADKKVEVVFPTSEVIEPEMDDQEVFLVTVNRQITIVKLGTLSAGAEVSVVPGKKESKQGKELNPPSDTDDQEVVIAADKTNLNVGAMVVIVWTSGDNACDIDVTMDGDKLFSLSGEAETTVAKLLMWDGCVFFPI